MKRKVAGLFWLSAALLAGQTKWPNTLRTWFADGTTLEIHTASSGAKSPLSTSGSVIVGAGRNVHRVVLDSQGNLLFTYDLAAERTTGGTYRLRIMPVDGGAFNPLLWDVDEAQIRKEKWFPKTKVAPRPLPTLAAAREFPPLLLGDEVQVDILYHPVTGERIMDVVRVVDQTRESKPARDQENQFSFQEVQVAVNGATIQEPLSTWIIGAAAMIRLPGRGDYSFSLQPSPSHPMQAAAWVDGKVLRFHAGSELVEVTGRSNILQKSEFATVWVYAIAEPPAVTAIAARITKLQNRLSEARKTYKAEHPDLLAMEKQITTLRQQLEAMESGRGAKPFVEIHTADSVDMLIPKKR